MEPANSKLGPGPFQSEDSSLPPKVILPTLTTPVFDQTLIGTTSVLSPDIEEFRGIPYGTVPGRWQHSLLRKSLPDDIFDASKNGLRCVQSAGPNNTEGYQSHLDYPSDVSESEFECLNLFIVRPCAAALSKAGLDVETKKLPIYVYIHGGAYLFGAGTDPIWNPSRLVQTSLRLGSPFIAVHINYRLTVFGFGASSDILAHQKDGLKGCNFGLGDQRTAIEWTYRNITAFGGDPDRITIGGQSAGGSSVHAHVLDAAFSVERPLFNRAIIQSGAVGTLGPMSLTEAEGRWRTLCELLQLHHLPPDRRMAGMLAVSADELQAAVQSTGWFVFPLVDDGLTLTDAGDHRWRASFRNDHTESVVPNTTDQKSKIHVMIGDTDTEGSVWRNQVFKLESIDQIRTKVKSSQVSETVIAEILQLYHLDQDVDHETLQQRVFTFLTDVTFGLPVQNAYDFLSLSDIPSKSAQIHQTEALTYRVKFGNPFPGPLFNMAQHCVDLIYIYDCFHDHLREMDDVPDQSESPMAKNADLVDQIQADWIGFITAEDRGKLSDHVSEDVIVTYGVDRKKRVTKKDEDKDYSERKARLEALRKHWRDAILLAEVLTRD